MFSKTMKWNYDYGAAQIDYTLNTENRPYWCTEDHCKEVVEYEHYLELNRKYGNQNNEILNTPNRSIEDEQKNKLS